MRLTKHILFQWAHIENLRNQARACLYTPGGNRIPRPRPTETGVRNHRGSYKENPKLRNPARLVPLSVQEVERRLTEGARPA